MTSFLHSDRSRPVAIWLAVVAVLVLAMVAVGGATRLTGSGLSITEWRPVTGAIPPLNTADWQAEFDRYKTIPQYQLINQGMTLHEFKGIYWWEWGHRLLGRLLGVVFFVPFVWFAVRGEIPKRLFLRLGVIFLLGALQGAVGWWMVASGLADRVSVAPERLAVHLGLAFALLAALVWSAMDAWSGYARQAPRGPWGAVGLALAGLIYFQVLLGALVAGNQAGFIYNDWPRMNGRLFPPDYAGADVWRTFAHSQAAVQFNHRLAAYVLTVAALAFAAAAWRSNRLDRDAKLLAVGVGAVAILQTALGVVTLMAVVPVGLGVAHQVTAALTFGLAVAFVWRARRA